MNNVFWIGVFPGLNDQQLEFTLQALRDSTEGAMEA
jgi:hypothetical protein